jgi:hypothetical protein
MCWISFRKSVLHFHVLSVYHYCIHNHCRIMSKSEISGSHGGEYEV